jgi:serine/threonine-protein kinase
MNPVRIADYEVLEKLGAGGMGTVYLGKHVGTGRVAAVKILPPTLAQSEGFVERFRREVDALKQFANPHIVRLYEENVETDPFYFAMEYVPGETVMSLLKREKRLSWQKTVSIGRQVCIALKAAHDAGVIHRDLKPSNLMVTPEGVVKLTDFGVAQVFAANRLTITGGVVGTAEFMSPEQAEGKRATRHSDIYSLGAVLYSLVTGRPPFTGNTAIDVIQKHKFGLFDPPRKYVPDIPLQLDELICQCLEKDPMKRPADALVLLRKLTQLERERIEVGEDGVTLITRADEIDADAETAPARARTGGNPRGTPGPATVMRGLVRAELQHNAEDDSLLQRVLNNTLVQVALLLLLVGSGVWLYMNSGSDGDSTAEFVSERDEAKRWLQLASHLHRSGDLAAADRVLTSLVAVLESDPESELTLRAAKQRLERIRAEIESGEQRSVEWARARLRRVGELAARGDMSGARNLLAALEGLYRGHPIVFPLVEETRIGLEKPEPAPGKPNGDEPKHP